MLINVSDAIHSISCAPSHVSLYVRDSVNHSFRFQTSHLLIVHLSFHKSSHIICLKEIRPKCWNNEIWNCPIAKVNLCVFSSQKFRFSDSGLHARQVAGIGSSRRAAFTRIRCGGLQLEQNGDETGGVVAFNLGECFGDI